MQWLQEQYINRLSGLLDRFKLAQTKPSPLYNFRCPHTPPFCGDSQKNKLKARAYLYVTGDSFSFHCHNCGLTLSFDRFLEAVDPSLHGDYIVAKMEAGGSRRRYVPASPDVAHTEASPPLPSDIFTRVDRLSPVHPVQMYVRRRKLPQKHWSLLYAVDEARRIAEFVPRYADRIHMTDQRLVLPVFNRAKYLVALITRAVQPNVKMRYLTVRIDETDPIVFGLDRVKWDQPITVVEGAIDSLFLSNAVAVGGSDLARARSILPSRITTYVFDNEPRNAEIVKKMRSLIAAGLKVCVWPDTPGKDVNEMILSGWTREKVEQIIREYSVDGLEAELRMSRWTRTS
jgi:hypothetical protein